MARTAKTNIKRVVGKSPVDRFWHYVNKTDYCWLWTGTLQVDRGYGQININNKTIHTHRFSWILHNGSIEHELQVLHKCDVRHCVNPHHLFLGTQEDNIQDMKLKNRSLVGIKNSASKLTETKVIEIRQRYLTEKISQHNLALHYGISQFTVFSIINRKTWRHI